MKGKNYLLFPNFGNDFIVSKISNATHIVDKIALLFIDSLPDGFDPTKIKLDFGGFRPVYSPGTVEYVENTVR